jgi:cholesterol transport system auxiliary component
VVLGQIEFPRASTSDGILTVTGDKTAYIDGARWVAPARVLFTEAVQGAFLAKSQKVQLVNVGEAGPAAAILSIRVTAFEARYQGDGPPTIAISLVARMTGSDGEFLDERPFSVTEQAQANSISMIVKAFDQGADEILGTLITWSDSQAAKAQAKVTSSPASPAASPTGTATISTTSSTSTVQSTTTAPR